MDRIITSVKQLWHSQSHLFRFFFFGNSYVKPSKPDDISLFVTIIQVSTRLTIN